MGDGLDEVGGEFVAGFLGEAADFVAEGAVGEFEVVIADEVFDGIDGEGDGDGDAEGADGEEFHGVFDADGAVGADAFLRGKADHLGAVKEEVAGAAFAGVDGELGDGLAEELGDGDAHHFVGDVVGENEDGAAHVGFDGADGGGGAR